MVSVTRGRTTGTPARFWSKWKEDVAGEELSPLLERPLPESVKASLFDLAFAELGVREEIAPYVVGRQVTEQDRALYALCRPERLLEMAWAFTVFDGGVRKIARYGEKLLALIAPAAVVRRTVTACPPGTRGAMRPVRRGAPTRHRLRGAVDAAAGQRA